MQAKPLPCTHRNRLLSYKNIINLDLKTFLFYGLVFLIFLYLLCSLFYVELSDKTLKFYLNSY